MFRRFVLGSFAAAALVGGSLAMAGAAQAQMMYCQAIFGAAGGCTENTFNRDSGPAPGTVVVTEQGTIWATGYASQIQQQQQQQASQAGPQTDAQSQAEE